MRFDLKHLDRELNCLLEGTVPPVDLNAVSAFRSCLERLAKKAGLGFRISLVHYYSSKIRQELFNVRVQLQTTSTRLNILFNAFVARSRTTKQLHQKSQSLTVSLEFFGLGCFTCGQFGWSATIE